MNKIIVIGKKSQLGSLLNAQIIAKLLDIKTIEATTDVSFSNIEKPHSIPEKIKEFGAKKTLLIGLKASTLLELIKLIQKKDASIENIVTHIEGPVPPNFEGYNVRYFPELKDIAA